MHRAALLCPLGGGLPSAVVPTAPTANHTVKCDEGRFFVNTDMEWMCLQFEICRDVAFGFVPAHHHQVAPRLLRQKKYADFQSKAASVAARSASTAQVVGPGVGTLNPEAVSLMLDPSSDVCGKISSPTENVDYYFSSVKGATVYDSMDRSFKTDCSPSVIPEWPFASYVCKHSRVVNSNLMDVVCRLPSPTVGTPPHETEMHELAWHDLFFFIVALALMAAAVAFFRRRARPTEINRAWAPALASIFMIIVVAHIITHIPGAQAYSVEVSEEGFYDLELKDNGNPQEIRVSNPCGVFDTIPMQEITCAITNFTGGGPSHLKRVYCDDDVAQTIKVQPVVNATGTCGQGQVVIMNGHVFVTLVRQAYALLFALDPVPLYVGSSNAQLCSPRLRDEQDSYRVPFSSAKLRRTEISPWARGTPPVDGCRVDDVGKARKVEAEDLQTGDLVHGFGRAKVAKKANVEYGRAAEAAQLGISIPNPLDGLGSLFTDLWEAVENTISPVVSVFVTIGKGIAWVASKFASLFSWFSDVSGAEIMYVIHYLCFGILFMMPFVPLTLGPGTYALVYIIKKFAFNVDDEPGKILWLSGWIDALPVEELISDGKDPVFYGALCLGVLVIAAMASYFLFQRIEKYTRFSMGLVYSPDALLPMAGKFLRYREASDALASVNSLFGLYVLDSISWILHGLWLWIWGEALAVHGPEVVVNLVNIAGYVYAGWGFGVTVALGATFAAHKFDATDLTDMGAAVEWMFRLMNFHQYLYGEVGLSELTQTGAKGLTLVPTSMLVKQLRLQSARSLVVSGVAEAAQNGFASVQLAQYGGGETGRTTLPQTGDTSARRARINPEAVRYGV